MDAPPPHGKMEIFRPGKDEPEPEPETFAQKARRIAAAVALTLFGILAFTAELLPFILAWWFPLGRLQ